MRCRLGLVAGLIAIAACSKSDVKSAGSGSSPDPGPPPRPTFTVFALAEVRGQIGPCGCTSDPLGDLSRTAQLIVDARAAGPTLVVDAGSLLYGKSPVPPQLDAQEELKAELLATTYQRELAVAAVGLGPADVAKGLDHVTLARQAVNLPEDAKVPREPPELEAVGGAQVGVFGVIAEGAIEGVAVTDPIAAGKRAVAELRGRGAQVVIGLIQAPSKRDAVKLMRKIGDIDLAIAGLGRAAPEPDDVEPSPQHVGRGWLVVPGNRGQVVSRIDVTLRGGGPLADAIGDAAARARRDALGKRIALLDADLAAFAKDPGADPAFVQHKRDERAGLIAERDRLARSPLAIPAAGSYFTLAQVRINKALACAPAVNDRVTAFYKAAGAANVKAAAGKKPAPPAKGKPGYTGGETCDDCHSEAVAFWKTTRHSHAWQTLVDRGQQFDFDCVGCHVTGWEQPGGSNMAVNEPLRDVQCEVCHGPGSIHVAKGGEEKPLAVTRTPAQDLCATQCHTKEHSDTFQLEAYLRDITGPGHAAALRKKLGDGPTGGQLRKAALEKAGRALGANCSR